MSWVGDENASLLVDLYELTMADAYQARGMNGPATFELFVRHLPEERNFLVAAGLEDALRFLERFHFGPESLRALERLRLLRPSFLEWLGRLRFTGEVWAVPEGELVFAGEPLLRVTAPLIEAQLLESFLLNCIGFQTLIASKAARIRLAAGRRRFVEFSLRRDHGADAALKAARAAYLGGADATSNVLAAVTYGIPASGTMAHSFVMAFDDEAEAFRAFAERFRGQAVLLIDTYDLEEGARNAASVARALARVGPPAVRGVRLDSGDLGEGARRVRALLDAGGCEAVEIVVSGDLDEREIAALVEGGAPIDAFGVGTQLGTSADAPALGAVYKLTEDARGPRLKLSEGKATLPGRKQVHRFLESGRMVRDVLALEGEPAAGGRPLLREAMFRGRRVSPPEPLVHGRDRCLAALRRLPGELRSLAPARPPYPLVVSERLRALTQALAAEHLRPAARGAGPRNLGGG